MEIGLEIAENHHPDFHRSYGIHLPGQVLRDPFHKLCIYPTERKLFSKSVYPCDLQKMNCVPTYYYIGYYFSFDEYLESVEFSLHFDYLPPLSLFRFYTY